MTKLNENETLVLENILKNLNAEEQTLDINSEKPLVYHKCHDQLSFVIDGNGFAQINEEVKEISRGSLILIKSNDRHSFMCKSGALTLLHVHTPKIIGEEDRYIEEDFSSKWKSILK
jgi:quercetin dioxygenase-like cupin family protein